MSPHDAPHDIIYVMWGHMNVNSYQIRFFYCYKQLNITNLVRHIIVNERRLAINITPIRLSCGDMSWWDIKTLSTLKY